MNEMNEPGQPPSDRGERIAQARRAKALKRLIWVLVAAIVIGGGGYGLVRYSRRAVENVPGTAIPDQGRPHVALGTPFAYNSNPPTSGPHYQAPAEWGVYEQGIPDQVLIHNLEHGGIWISYRPGVASSTVEALSAIAREFGRKVVMAPRAANDTDIALAAWGRLDTFSVGEFSEDRVRAFVRAWRNKGPEFVP